MQSERAIRVVLSVLAAASGVVCTTLASGWFTIYVAPGIGSPSWLVPAILGSGVVSVGAFVWLMLHVFRDDKQAADAARDEAVAAQARMRGVPERQIGAWREMREFLGLGCDLLGSLLRRGTYSKAAGVVAFMRDRVLEGVKSTPQVFGFLEWAIAPDSNTRYLEFAQFILETASHSLKPWDLKPALPIEHWSWDGVDVDALARYTEQQARRKDE